MDLSQSQAAIEQLADEGGDTHEARVERLAEAMHILSDLMLNVNIKDALKRNETRKQAHENLGACIDALAAMASATAMYGDAMIDSAELIAALASVPACTNSSSESKAEPVSP